MNGADIATHFLTLARQLPASAWEPHPNPLLHWDILRLLAGGYRVEVVHQRYDDFWRVQVFPLQVTPTNLLLLSAEGPLLAPHTTIMQAGLWTAVVPLPVAYEGRRYGRTA